MLACLGLIFMTQWLLLVAQMCIDWQCTDLEMPEPPIRNLTLNPWKMELSWIGSTNFTEYKCSVAADNEKAIIKAEDMTCIFDGNLMFPLHNGANFSVTAVNINSTYSSICTCIPRGIKESAIENFSCVIYDVSLMNCTWQAGRNAPGDTQYFLYWKNSRGDYETECELYIKDENGRHMGCRFQNVMIKYKTAYFMVNGSSNVSQIRFYDKYIELYTIEKLMPPSNVTVNCDKKQNDCIIQWQRPQISHSDKDRCFKYEVKITYKGNSAEEVVHTFTKEIERSHILQSYSTGKKYLVKIRASGHDCYVNNAWGEWSAAVEFGNEDVFSSSIWILSVVAVAIFLVFFFTVLFCKRTHYWKTAFPPVPKPKNPFTGQHDINPELMECKMQSITSENEQILVAELVK
uniref:Fibronectin type-III domain-containing protein n=1 Tax=Cairina moschata TaxID=8855 RepID=A0A8C3B970_CAIMO